VNRSLVDPKSASGQHDAFTLIEILVALVVLTFLGVVIAEITGQTSRAIRLSNQNIDSAAEARIALDRIGLDLAALVCRPDVDFEIQNAPIGPNNLLIFLSGVSSASSQAANRGVSVVSYQLNTHPDNQGPDGNPRLCLTRAGKAIAPNSTGFFGLNTSGLPVLFTDPSFPSSLLPKATATGTTTDYDILAPGIIRLVFGFQLYPDNAQVTLQDATVIANSRGQIVYSPPTRTVTSTDGTISLQLVDLKRISAIIVGVVVVDLQNLTLLNNTQVSALANAFATPTTSQDLNQTPAQLWIPVSDQVAALPSTVPLPARQALRVFQRFFPITSFASQSP
jgi:prepilin-type N-terminal cleavage/methylation domain-containing protein